MVSPKIIITKKVEVLIKNATNRSDLSLTKLEFDNSTAEIKVPYLLIHTRELDTYNVTTKLFNLNEIASFKEHKEIATL